MESFLQVAMVSGNGTTVVFLEGLLEKFLNWLSQRNQVETQNPFGLKRIFSCINIPDKFLKPSPEQLSTLVWFRKEYDDT